MSDGDDAGPKHFLDVDDLRRDRLERVLDRAAALKSGSGPEGAARLPDRTLGMLFEKPSTRTRVSFETGMTQLGGHAIFLGPDDTQLGRGEPIRDTARALSRYVDGMMVRLYDHGDLETMAEHATVPVINGLTDDAHPCQTLADLQTLRERFGHLDGLAVAWVGDGNNVARSFAVGCAMTGVDLTVATPAGHGLGEDVLDRASDLGGRPTTTTDPAAAVAGADAVYTDVWVSMGEEDRRESKLADFEGFQVNADLLAGADAAVLHCLPAHRGEEITDDVIEGERSVVFQQAENRLHAQKALLVELLAGPAVE
ncbi:MAG: ornithine carbamoyltransferase [Halobacteriaceae archaeon]